VLWTDSLAEQDRLDDLLMDSDRLLAILEEANRALDSQGEQVLPLGPEDALIDFLHRNLDRADPMALAVLHTFRRVYGAGVVRIRRQVVRYWKALRAFVAAFGRGPAAVARAPARINILGEHVDYVRYLPTQVLPFASREHDMLMVFRPSDEPAVRGRSTHADVRPAEFRLDQGPRPEAHEQALDQRWVAYLRQVGTPEQNWINYVKGSALYAAMKHPGRVGRGFDFLVDSTIPAAGGASSSSAIVTLSGCAIRLVNGLSLDAAGLAEDSSRAEWYIGTRGGNMDHCAQTLAQRQHALSLWFSPFAREPVPLHRFRYRWVTFFAHPADKSGAVLLEYNERSAVSRLVIPALLERMFEVTPGLKERWDRIFRALSEDRLDLGAAREARTILSELPEAMTLSEVKGSLPEVYAELQRGYPLLGAAPGERLLKVRSRALHHVGEIERVRQVVHILRDLFASPMPEEPEKIEPGLRAVGELITETHDSMRDLYELTTPDIDALAEIILGFPGVYGARLMGGGFGGNILVLIAKENVPALVRRVEKQFYQPRGRRGDADGDIMISTPGEGLSVLDLRAVLRRAMINASAVWWEWDKYQPVVDKCACTLLGIDEPPRFRLRRPVQPVIVAGPRRTASAAGTRPSPKPASPSLQALGDRTSLERVVSAIRSMPFPTLSPIIVVGPSMAHGLRHGLSLPPDVRLAVQADPLGTGDAVLAALRHVQEQTPDASANHDVLVVWGSQPLLRPRTLARSIMYHQALGAAAMLFPTVVTTTPYAPVSRDLRGYIVASRETATEGAPSKRLGETNIGAFVLSAGTLADTLTRIHDDLYDPAGKRYRTPSGELGFPNEMARALARAGRPVIALPIAAYEESLGLRTRAGCEEVRRIISGKEERE